GWGFKSLRAHQQFTFRWSRLYTDNLPIQRALVVLQDMRSRFRQRSVLALIPHKELVVAIHSHGHNNPASEHSRPIRLRDIDVVRNDGPAYRALGCPILGKPLQRIT